VPVTKIEVEIFETTTADAKHFTIRSEGVPRGRTGSMFTVTLREA
jgi:hypothetical protein